MSPLSALCDWLTKLPNLSDNMPESEFRFLDALAELEDIIDHYDYCEADAEAAQERYINAVIDYGMEISEEIYDEIATLENELSEVKRKLDENCQSELAEKIQLLLKMRVFEVYRAGWQRNSQS